MGGSNINTSQGLNQQNTILNPSNQTTSHPMTRLTLFWSKLACKESRSSHVDYNIWSLLVLARPSLRGNNFIFKISIVGYDVASSLLLTASRHDRLSWGVNSAARSLLHVKHGLITTTLQRQLKCLISKLHAIGRKFHASLHSTASTKTRLLSVCGPYIHQEKRSRIRMIVDLKV